MRSCIRSQTASPYPIFAIILYWNQSAFQDHLVLENSDPIKQRDFWYLYRARALPAETREYVPKVFAAIIIGRNPVRFGFLVSKLAQ
jgi:hypothetical protein